MEEECSYSPAFIPLLGSKIHLLGRSCWGSLFKLLRTSLMHYILWSLCTSDWENNFLSISSGLHCPEWCWASWVIVTSAPVPSSQNYSFKHLTFALHVEESFRNEDVCFPPQNTVHMTCTWGAVFTLLCCSWNPYLSLMYYWEQPVLSALCLPLLAVP